MFLALLDDDEKRAFTLLAEKMIVKDGIAVTSETRALANLRHEMGLDEDAFWEDKGLDELAAAFGSRRSKVAALLELVGLGYSDRTYSAAESGFTMDIARAMGMATELDRIEAWVQQHVRHVEAALEMMQ